jgi:hypothetical protein
LKSNHGLKHVFLFCDENKRKTLLLFWECEQLHDQQRTEAKDCAPNRDSGDDESVVLGDVMPDDERRLCARRCIVVVVV